MFEILQCFKLILCNSNLSKDHFNYFKANHAQIIGNLKFIVSKNQDLENVDNYNLQNRIKFIALSTHDTEEELCVKTHISLKQKYPNLLTIIIPRHINRIVKIEEMVRSYKLNFLAGNSLSNVKNQTDILIINSYGNTEKFLKLSKFIFIGGSLINHGGQNPMEVAYNNSFIFHGPYVHNFTEMYNFLHNENIAFEVKSEKELIEQLEKRIKTPKNININEKIIKIGNEILLSTIEKLDQYIVN